MAVERSRSFETGKKADPTALRRRETKSEGVIRKQRNEKPKVLLVEDDPGIASKLTCMLKGKGYEVIHAKTFFEATARFDRLRRRLAAVVTETVFPKSKDEDADLNGPFLIDYMKRKAPTLPVIALAGPRDYSSEEHLMMAKRMGADSAMNGTDLAGLPETMERLFRKEAFVPLFGQDRMEAISEFRRAKTTRGFRDDAERTQWRKARMERWGATLFRKNIKKKDWKNQILTAFKWRRGTYFSEPALLGAFLQGFLREPEKAQELYKEIENRAERFWGLYWEFNESRIVPRSLDLLRQMKRALRRREPLDGMRAPLLSILGRVRRFASNMGELEKMSGTAYHDGNIYLAPQMESLLYRLDPAIESGKGYRLRKLREEMRETEYEIRSCQFSMNKSVRKHALLNLSRFMKEAYREAIRTTLALSQPSLFS